MKIVVLDGFALNPGDMDWKKINSVGDLIVYDRTEEKLIVNRIGSNDAVLTNKTPITRETIDACPSIRYIGILSTGYNLVDVDYAKSKGIVVCNVPSYSTASVVQHVFSLLLAITNHVAEHSQTVSEHRWQRSRDFCYWKFPIVELAGKTLGIVGFGQIGQGVARVALALGMRVAVYTPHPRPEQFPQVEFLPLEQLYGCADVLSLHCPLTPQTRHLIHRQSLAKMKPGVILINTSRGQLIQEWDLSVALNSGQVSYAGVDVLEQEPPVAGSPLIDHPHCFVTPHIAWAARECRVRLMEIAYQNLVAFRDGHPQNAL